MSSRPPVPAVGGCRHRIAASGSQPAKRRSHKGIADNDVRAGRISLTTSLRCTSDERACEHLAKAVGYVLRFSVRNRANQGTG